jgi:hypothetical protein
MRGARGVAITEDRIFIANYSIVHCFDTAWQFIGSISHPSCANIHDIFLQDKRLWVTSSRNDLIFEFDLEVNIQSHLNLRSFDQLKAAGWNKPNLLTQADILSGQLDFHDPRQYKEWIYDRFHVNSLCFLPNGDILIMLGYLSSAATYFIRALKAHLLRTGRWQSLVAVNQLVRRIFRLKPAMHTEMVANVSIGKSAIVRLHQNSQVSLLLSLPRVNSPTHSLLATADGAILFNFTSTGEVVCLDPEKSRILRKVRVTDGFLRGIVQLPDGLVAAGSNNNICLVDLEKPGLVDQICLSRTPGEVIYDVKVLPPQFEALPDRLWQPSWLPNGRIGTGNTPLRR